MPRAPHTACDTWRLTLLLTGLSQVLADHHHYHASPLSLLNPWLSACDIATPNTATDLQGACKAVMAGQYISFSHAIRVNGDITEGPGPPPEGTCPRACSNPSMNASQNQCLYYFHDKHKDALCYGSKLTVARLAELRLRHCCEHTVASSLTPEILSAILSSSSKCSHYLGVLFELDLLAARVSCEFGEILYRFDCDHPYSVTSACSQCQVAYRRWACSSIIPHFPQPGGPRVRPCRSACRTVEKNCPFFLPNDRAPNYPTQYAGEPTFLCQDPNIPESGDQLQRSAYGEDSCCYNHCTEATGLPGLCTTPNASCVDPVAQSSDGATPAAVVCEPPPPAPTPAPGDRTLPSACAPSLPTAPPRAPGSGARAAHSLNSCLLGLVGIVLLLQHITGTAEVSSPARKPTASALGTSCGRRGPRGVSSHPARLKKRPLLSQSRASIIRSSSWERRIIYHDFPFVLQLSRRKVSPKEVHLGIRTKTMIMSSLFCFEHVT